MPSTCAIVLNWNNPADTIECLRSLLHLETATDELSIVCCDNASSDDSVAQIEAWARTHTPGSQATFWLIRTSGNHGYAAGNNAAIAFALEQSAFDFVWILNSDTVVEPGSLTSLLACAAEPEHARTGIFGSTIVRMDDPDRLECAAGFRYRPALTVTTPLLAGLTRERALLAPYPGRIDAISGAAALLRRATWRDVGPLDERFFLYCEEIDYARRTRAVGWELAWCRDAFVRHRGAASTTSTVSHYHENLSHLRYTKKHHSMWLLPIAWTARLSMKLLRSLQRRQPLGPVVRAYLDFGRGRDRQPPATGGQTRLVLRRSL